MSSFIYLASQSPRRRQLLEQIGVRYEMLLPGENEDTEQLEAEREGEPPEVYVERVTRAKLSAARERLRARKLPLAPILCADTTVAIDGRMFGKPVDAEDAKRVLRELSGVAHLVLTAVAVSADIHTTIERTLYDMHVSVVHMAEVPDIEIIDYVASGDAFGKAGSYAIQSRAAAWVRHIEGSYSGIMGLPLFETAQLLKQAGVSFR